MKGLGKFLGMVFWVLTLAGCGPGSFESLAPKTLDAMEELASLMKTVTDEATGQAALAGLRKTKDRLDALNAKINEINPPSQRIQEWYGKNQARTEAAARQLHKEVLRLASIPGGPEILNQLHLR